MKLFITALLAVTIYICMILLKNVPLFDPVLILVILLIVRNAMKDSKV